MPSFRSFFNKPTQQSEVPEKSRRLADTLIDVATSTNVEVKVDAATVAGVATGLLVGAVAGALFARRRRRQNEQTAQEDTPPAPATPAPQPKPSGRILQQALEKDISDTRDKMRGYAADLQAGRMTLNEFEQNMKGEIVRQHIRSSILGAGGAGNLTENQDEIATTAMKAQLGYLENFVKEIEERGNTPRDISRAGQYADAGRVTATQVERQSILDRGDEEDALVEERRVLQPAEHCKDCVEYAELGWQPVGSLPPIGDSRCGQNCKCRFEYRTTQYDSERRDVAT